MANKSISQLDQVTTPNDGDVIAVVNEGSTRKMTLSDLRNVVLSTSGGGSTTVVSGAENGLTVNSVNNNIKLGGFLIETTAINQDNFTLNFHSGPLVISSNPQVSALSSGSKVAFITQKGAIRGGVVPSLTGVSEVGYNSLSIGSNNKSVADQSVTFGAGTQAFGANSLVVGASSQTGVGGDNAIVVGSGNTVDAHGAFALGIGAKVNANGHQSISAGNSTEVNASGAMALGNGSKIGSNGHNSLAVGLIAEANGPAALAVGHDVIANGASSFALGTNNTQSLSPITVAIGNNAQAGKDANSGAHAFAMGRNVKAYSTLSVVMGCESTAGLNDDGTPHVTSGGQEIEATSSFAFGTAARTRRAHSFAFGLGVTADGYGAFAFGNGVSALQSHSFAFGNNGTRAEAYHAFAFGQSAVAEANFTLAFGQGSSASSPFAIAAGYQTQANKQASISLGCGTLTEGLESVAMGFQTKAYGNQSFAAGRRAIAGQATGTTTNLGQGAVALGDTVVASNDYTVGLGSYNTSSAVGSMVIGKGIGGPDGTGGTLTTNPLVNNKENSLMIGFNSEIPTLFVGSSQGAGTTGNVGIAIDEPEAKLHINGDLKLENGTNVNDIVTTINTSSPSDDKLATEKAIADLIGQDAGGNVTTAPFSSDNKLITTDTTNGSTNVKESGISVDANDNLLGLGILSNKDSLTSPLESQVVLGSSELAMEFNGAGITVDDTGTKIDAGPGAGGQSFIVGSNRLTVGVSGGVGINVLNAARNLSIGDANTGIDGSATSLNFTVDGSPVQQNTLNSGDVFTRFYGNIGVNQAAVDTAALSLQAKSSDAHLNFNAPTTPGTPSEGDVWMGIVPNVGPRLLFYATGQTFNLISPNTSKGDLTVHNGTLDVRLPAGNDGQILQADSSTAEGLTWVDAASTQKSVIKYDFSMSGQANSTPGLLSKGLSSNSNPGGIPTTSPSVAGIQNGGVDPYMVSVDSTVKSIRIALGQASVGTGTVGSDVKARFQLFKLEYSTRTLLGTFDISLDESSIGINNNLGLNSFQTAVLDGLSVQLTAGDLIGLQFTNVGSDNNFINAMGRIYASLETETD